MSQFKSLKDYVYDHIALKITTGEITPEKKIDEKKICDELSISRTPVREALIQLSSEGILENVPRKGFVVRPLGAEEAIELYVVVGALDGLSARHAIPHMTENLLKNMEFYTASMDLAISSGNYEMYHNQQLLFHQTYVDACKNETLISSISKLKKKFIRIDFHLESTNEIEKLLFHTNEEHKEILRLFREKNANQLEHFIRTVHWNPELASLEKL